MNFIAFFKRNDKISHLAKYEDFSIKEMSIHI